MAQKFLLECENHDKMCITRGTRGTFSIDLTTKTGFWNDPGGILI